MTKEERIEAIMNAAKERGAKDCELTKKLNLEHPYMERQRAHAARFRYV